VGLFDENTGIVTVIFFTLDPTTNQIVDDDPIAGFLLPNLVSPNGEGMVSFTIDPYTTIGHNDTIFNKAYIYFDENDPIITNNWQVIIDFIAPESNVLPLESVTDNASFEVNWEGSDELSGIRNYDIYVSVNDSAYYKWLHRTSLTSAIFEGQNGNRYRFYSVARDSAGNVEEHNLEGDAETQIILGIKSPTVFQPQIKIIPNPSDGSFFVEFKLQSPKTVNIYIKDLLGASVANLNGVSINDGVQRIQLSYPELKNGTYIIEIRSEDLFLSGKAVILK
jgi:hypothetical protein